MTRETPEQLTKRQRRDRRVVDVAMRWQQAMGRVAPRLYEARDRLLAGRPGAEGFARQVLAEARQADRAGEP